MDFKTLGTKRIYAYVLLSSVIGPPAFSSDDVILHVKPIDQFEGNFPINPSLDIPRHCLWTTSVECGTAIAPLKSTQVQKQRQIPHHCKWTTSVECGTAQGLPQYSFGIAEISSDIPRHCLWTTSAECGNAIIPPAVERYDNGFINFCWEHYPLCVVTPTSFVDPNPIIVTPDRIENVIMLTEAEDRIEAIESTRKTTNEAVETPETAPVNDSADRTTSSANTGDEGQESARPIRVTNPFSHTPLGQPLRAGIQPISVPTQRSATGGYFGFTRSQGRKWHGGFDENLTWFNPTGSIVVTYYGELDMFVRGVSPAYDKLGRITKLGGIAELVGVDDFGNTFMSGYVHLHEIFVKAGQRVKNGDLIGRGYGAGSMMMSDGAGLPHLHWKLEVNGVRVDPLNSDFLLQDE